MITNLVQGTTPLTVLVLVNAVYMKGKWANPFKKKMTKVGDFYVSNTRTVKANFMYQKSSFRYTRKEEEKFALCFLPYRAESRDTSWVMGILLPEKGLNVTEFLKYLEPKRLMNLHYNAHQIKLKVKLPKVKLEAKVDLIPFFKSLGVQAAFGMEADLTGIRFDLLVSVENFSIIHFFSDSPRLHFNFCHISTIVHSLLKVNQRRN